MQGQNSPSRVVILTGAAGVLGSAIAFALLRAGHRVVLTDRTEESLRQLVERCDVKNEAVAIRAVDLTDESSADALEQCAVEAFGGVDMLINNAALTAFAAWPDATQPNAWQINAELVRRFFDINFVAQHALTNRIVPGMIARRWGRIVNVTCSYNTMQRHYPYGATKAALEAYTAALEAQLTGTGVTASTLTPGGPVYTPTHFAHNPNLNWVQPEVVNAPLLWLATDASNGVGGRRYVGSRWAANVDVGTALAQASGPMAWQGFGAEPHP